MFIFCTLRNYTFKSIKTINYLMSINQQTNTLVLACMYKTEVLCKNRTCHTSKINKQTNTAT